MNSHFATDTNWAHLSMLKDEVGFQSSPTCSAQSKEIYESTHFSFKRLRRDLYNRALSYICLKKEKKKKKYMHVYLHTPAQPKKQRKEEFQNKTKPPAKPRKAYDDFGIQDPASISPNQIPFLHVFFKEKCFTPNFYPY